MREGVGREGGRAAPVRGEGVGRGKRGGGGTNCQDSSTDKQKWYQLAEALDIKLCNKFRLV